MDKSSRFFSRRHILQASAVAGIGAAIGTVSTFLRAQPPQPAELGTILPQMKVIQEALHQRACELVDGNRLIHDDGYIYTIDFAQLMIHFANVKDAARFTALRKQAERNLILTDNSFVRGFVAWRWKPNTKLDATGTTEALRLARALWLGAKAFNRPADADLAVEILNGYARHGAVDQNIWLIRNYYNIQINAFACNSYLVDYDPDFVREVADERGDKELGTLADNCYGVVKMATAPSGLLYDIIQPEVSTLYPELNLAAFSPNDVVQFSNCCTTATAVARGAPEIARRILAFGMNRLEDLRVYYFARTGEPYNGKTAYTPEKARLALLAARLGSEYACATVADRAMNNWRSSVRHLDTMPVFTLAELLLSMHEIAALRA